jgi:hypothetical protein
MHLSEESVLTHNMVSQSSDMVERYWVFPACSGNMIKVPKRTYDTETSKFDIKAEILLLKDHLQNVFLQSCS